VLHPSFSLSWFGKLDEGQEREENAKILFMFAYEAYKKIYDDEEAATRTGAGKSHTRSRRPREAPIRVTPEKSAKMA
jgi:hypothetical protein